MPYARTAGTIAKKRRCSTDGLQVANRTSRALGTARDVKRTPAQLQPMSAQALDNGRDGSRLGTGAQPAAVSGEARQDRMRPARPALKISSDLPPSSMAAFLA
ncbi:hypothetical protein P4U99_13115 [Brevibacillus agri]|uniref:Uncharacterized protein n=1 Tax=Brevibacillus agri TaxID=51101 RepID=A0A3M8AWC2_9BACL|nr:MULTISPECIES: hypothetical protein [Brevibacillus]ELK41243.1 hypothetical protein D478_15035 [Brevibacillus agri BAB-2500]MBG9566855.1 hypothetical protein [Brevibacillus agri]MBY0052214.1 hypothetical protein [Brevibacillus agri]MCG5254243.1 hypothetical protein [Brevibacillus agri]MDN4095239.1 hypothetical protein [Brevibacillus agri]